MAKTKIPTFQNETYKDYTLPRERKAMEAALRKTGDSLGKIYPHVIGGERIGTNDAIASRNPARPSEVIGNFAKGTTQHAEQALQTASKAFLTWSKSSFRETREHRFQSSEDRSATTMRN